MIQPQETEDLPMWVTSKAKRLMTKRMRANTEMTTTRRRTTTTTTTTEEKTSAVDAADWNYIGYAQKTSQETNTSTETNTKLTKAIRR